jgi:protein phosphatase 1 regulatory subunit 7
MPSEKETTPPLHISLGSDAEGHDTPKTPRSSSGWDGKLRVEKKLELANPEALSDPEYSDDENVHPGETIDADEGISYYPSMPALTADNLRFA